MSSTLGLLRTGCVRHCSESAVLQHVPPSRATDKHWTESVGGRPMPIEHKRGYVNAPTGSSGRDVRRANSLAHWSRSEWGRSRALLAHPPGTIGLSCITTVRTYICISVLWAWPAIFSLFFFLLHYLYWCSSQPAVNAYRWKKRRKALKSISAAMHKQAFKGHNIRNFSLVIKDFKEKNATK